MNEKKGGRREWVKTAAIIFLSIMLVLTFFSNTIMNYSLPEVATQYAMSGSITMKVRGTGTVESGSLYNVMVKESRKVTALSVRTGDHVEIGDVICELDDTESAELTAAREILKTAQDAYDLALLSADLSVEVRQNGGSAASVSSYRNQILAAQNEVTAAQKEVDEWQKKYDAFDIQISITPSNTANTTEEVKAVNAAKTAKDNADFLLTQIKNEISNLENQITYVGTVSSGDASIDEMKAQKTAKEQDLIAAQKTADDAALALSKAETALQRKQESGDTTATINNLRQQQAVVKVNLDAAAKTLADKQEALVTLTSNISATLNLSALYEAVVAAEEEVKRLEGKAIGATVKAEVAGTIISLNVVAGESTTTEVPVAVIQPEGKGFTMSFSVTNDQAKRISVGDPGELVNAWYYSEILVTVASIKPDPSSPNQNKLITFDLVGDLMAGQSLSVQVGQRSANYDAIVPNSAVREDNNGKFVLVVEAKSSPLGTRYYAVRYDVEVLASDDTQSAVSGLAGYESVITTATKPVEAGKLVRLPD